MIIDLIAAILISLGFYLGYQRGLINTIFDTLSIFIGILAALKFSPMVINLLKANFNMNAGLLFIVGIVITFIGVMLIIRYIGRKFEDVLKAVNINFVNKIAGGVLQSFFFAVLLSYFIGLTNKINFIKPETAAASVTYPQLMKMPEYSSRVIDALKPVFSGFWKVTTETMDEMKNKVNAE